MYVYQTASAAVVIRFEISQVEKRSIGSAGRLVGGKPSQLTRLITKSAADAGELAQHFDAG
eukprot:gene52-12869_t